MLLYVKPFNHCYGEFFLRSLPVHSGHYDLFGKHINTSKHKVIISDDTIVIDGLVFPGFAIKRLDGSEVDISNVEFI